MNVIHLLLLGIAAMFSLIFAGALLLRRRRGMLAELIYRDSRPIYGQIKDGLRRLIVTGALEPDEKLPSVRALAIDLAINPNTIQRAYAELEREGFLATVPGKGCFVAAQNRETRREAVLCQIEEHLSQAVDAAKAGAVGLDELIEMLNTLYNEV